MLSAENTSRSIQTMDLIRTGQDILANERHSRWVSLLLVAGEGLLCALIVLKVPYTEIDWSTYMQQVRLFLKGERDYRQIEGDTGPLVYPALHVYIYSVLYYLTDNGTSILKAQLIFVVLYIFTLSVVIKCYRTVGAPPYVLGLLVLSKRLHSIFLLRLFNDAWAALGFWAAILLLQQKHWLLGALAWSAGVGVKMTVLLAAPAVGAILIQGAGQQDGIIAGAFIGQFQLMIGLPFMVDGNARSYVARAFQLSRQFLYKWTVNWRMIPENIFLSRPFSLLLLVCHVVTIALFLNDRWLKPSSNNIVHFLQQYRKILPDNRENQIANRVSPIFVMDSMIGSMAIGLLFARSLHYQFFAYLGWATPFLLWRTGLRMELVCLVWAAQEVAWLVFPSTVTSSSVVVVCLAAQVVGLWLRTGREAAGVVDAKVDSKLRSEVGGSKEHVE